MTTEAVSNSVVTLLHPAELILDYGGLDPVPEGDTSVVYDQDTGVLTVDPSAAATDGMIVETPLIPVRAGDLIIYEGDHQGSAYHEFACVLYLEEDEEADTQPTDFKDLIGAPGDWTGAQTWIAFRRVMRIPDSPTIRFIRFRMIVPQGVESEFRDSQASILTAANLRVLHTGDVTVTGPNGSSATAASSTAWEDISLGTGFTPSIIAVHDGGGMVAQPLPVHVFTTDGKRQLSMTAAVQNLYLMGIGDYGEFRVLVQVVANANLTANSYFVRYYLLGEQAIEAP